MEEQTEIKKVTPALAVQTYILDRMVKHVKGALDARKDQIKAIVGPGGKADVEGLKFTVSSPQSRDSFNPQLAIDVLGDTKYATMELIITAKVKTSEIPKEVLDSLSQYFDIERKFTVTQGDADLAILNGDCDKHAVYDKGKSFCSLTLGSKKVSNDEIAAMYREICPDTSVLALMVPDDADEEEA